MVRILNSHLFFQLCRYITLPSRVSYIHSNVRFLNEEYLLGKTFNETLTLSQLVVVRADKEHSSNFKQC